LLGLAIHLYMPLGRRKLVYVVLFNDGLEAHIPCGSVEPIRHTVADQSGNNTKEQRHTKGKHLLGHASSLEISDAHLTNSEAVGDL